MTGDYSTSLRSVSHYLNRREMGYLDRTHNGNQVLRGAVGHGVGVSVAALFRAGNLAKLNYNSNSYQIRLEV